MPEEEEIKLPIDKLAYFAGFFDGEGCVYISSYTRKRNKKPLYVLVISISNTNPIALKEICKYFGGSIKISRIKNANGRNTKTLWQWRVSSRLAENFLSSILPYVMLKKQEIEVALIYRKLCNYRHPRRHGYDKNTIGSITESIEKLRELKRTNYIM